MNFLTGHAKAWLNNQITMSTVDTIVTKEGADGRVVLPYDTLQSLHDVYVDYSRMQGDLERQIACSYGCFKAAFDSFGDKLKLLGSKGNFPTCDICNKCNELLRNASKKLDAPMRAVVLHFKNLHLRQQSRERQVITSTLVSYIDLNAIYKFIFVYD